MTISKATAQQVAKVPYPVICGEAKNIINLLPKNPEKSWVDEDGKIWNLATKGKSVVLYFILKEDKEIFVCIVNTGKPFTQIQHDK